MAIRASTPWQEYIARLAPAAQQRVVRVQKVWRGNRVRLRFELIIRAKRSMAMPCSIKSAWGRDRSRHRWARLRSVQLTQAGTLLAKARKDKLGEVQDEVRRDGARGRSACISPLASFIPVTHTHDVNAGAGADCSQPSHVRNVGLCAHRLVAARATPRLPRGCACTCCAVDVRTTRRALGSIWTRSRSICRATSPCTPSRYHSPTGRPTRRAAALPALLCAALAAAVCRRSAGAAGCRRPNAPGL